MKKIIACLTLLTLIPAALVIGCGSTNSPSSSNTNATPTVTPINTVGPAALSLGRALTSNFAVLSYNGVTDANESICGNLGISSNSSESGPTPVYGTGACAGTAYLADQTSLNAMTDITAAEGVAASLTPTIIASTFGTLPLAPGIYACSGGTFASNASSVLTLANTGGNPNNVYIFLATSISTGTSSSIVLQNVKAANVFWVATTSIGLGANSSFAGNLLAGSTVIPLANVNLEGRMFSGSAITFNTGDVITNP